MFSLTDLAWGLMHLFKSKPLERFWYSVFGFDGFDLTMCHVSYFGANLGAAPSFVGRRCIYGQSVQRGATCGEPELRHWNEGLEFRIFRPGGGKIWRSCLGRLFGTGTSHKMTNANRLFGDFMIWRGITDFHCYVLREGTICLFCLWTSAIRREFVLTFPHWPPTRTWNHTCLIFVVPPQLGPWFVLPP